MPDEPVQPRRADAVTAVPSRVTCAVCGATVAAPPPLTWSLSTTGRRVLHVCAGCTRLHLRSMEAKLEQEHW